MIKELIRKRDAAYKGWKRFKFPQLRDEFLSLTEQVDKTIQREKAKYYEMRHAQPDANPEEIHNLQSVLKALCTVSKGWDEAI